MKNLPSDEFLDRKDPYLRMLCVNVFVRDQDKSLRFYVDQLGFAVVIDESYESGGRWVAVAPPDGNTVLALVAPTRKSEEYKLIGRSRHALVGRDAFVREIEAERRAAAEKLEAERRTAQELEIAKRGPGKTLSPNAAAAQNTKKGRPKAALLVKPYY